MRKPDTRSMPACQIDRTRRSVQRKSVQCSGKKRAEVVLQHFLNTEHFVLNTLFFFWNHDFVILVDYVVFFGVDEDLVGWFAVGFELAAGL